MPYLIGEDRDDGDQAYERAKDDHLTGDCDPARCGYCKAATKKETTP